ncbi:MAG: repressor LexA [Planctomycetaceae bacterium]|jgi:repressor LexA|nr:repressor LexA [Planctomycetaceae bacterium]MEC9004833.1 transcriptional repressor LexA [Planctomycetota bacterium]
MSAMQTLTQRQRAVYEMIRDKIINRGYGPTVREIGEHFGINSPNGVMCHLKAIEKKGLIRRSPNKSRAIELTQEESMEPRGLQMAGTVVAGATNLAFEQTDRIDFDELFERQDQFVLEVRGDSMIEAQIADGDYVVIRQQKTAQQGQMVVARTDNGEATLKYWYLEKDQVRLQPANSAMKPIYVDDAEVVGVVVGVVRHLS